MFIAINQAGWYLIGATGLFLLVFIIFLLFYYKVQMRQNLFMLKEEQMKFKYQEQLLQTQIEIQEQTLKTISQEIHDNIGQALTLAKLNLSTMLPIADEQLQRKVLNSKDLVGKAIGDLRHLSHSLDTDYVQEMGLQRAIEYELEMILKSGTLQTIFEIQGAPFRLNKQKELVLFRITQESLNNILKHAEARTIMIVMAYSPGSLEMRITDDGKGVDLENLPTEEAGLGIRNMHKRAQLIGASFNMNSTLQEGTTITIFLPVETNLHEPKQ